jgi:acyl-CoA hydrolase
MVKRNIRQNVKNFELITQHAVANLYTVVMELTVYVKGNEVCFGLSNDVSLTVIITDVKIVIQINYVTRKLNEFY